MTKEDVLKLGDEKLLTSHNPFLVCCGLWQVMNTPEFDKLSFGNTKVNKKTSLFAKKIGLIIVFFAILFQKKVK